MINTKIAIIAVLAIIFCTIAVGCSKEIVRTQDTHIPVETEPNVISIEVGPPDIIGEVKDVQISDAMRVLIDSTSGDIKGEVWVTINEDTIFMKDFKDYEKIKNVDVTTFFVVGDNIGVLSNGAIMESYPMQTTAFCVYQSVD